MASTTWSHDFRAVGKSSTKGTSRSSSCLVSRCVNDKRRAAQRREPALLGMARGPKEMGWGGRGGHALGRQRNVYGITVEGGRVLGGREHATGGAIQGHR